MPTKQIDDFPGTERFAVLRRLGAGGMGVVYEVEDREHGGRVALKTLPRADAALLYHLKSEFRSLADVTHPNLAALHELISDGGRWFFTMELIDGVSFLQYVRYGCESPPADPLGRTYADDKPPAPTTTSTTVLPAADMDQVEAATVPHTPAPTVPAAAPVSRATPPPQYLTHPAQFARLRAALRQLVAGVSALHAAGKLHRDIKPSNVLVTAAARVVLLDFGLVTDLDPRRGGDGSEPAGTFGYMAPEQAAGQPLSPASDWYAVGVLLYEALTGRLPFEGARLSVLHDKQHADALPPSARAPAVPADLDALCVALLSRRPADRPGAADILRRLGGDNGRAAPPPDRLRPAPLVGRERHLQVLAEAFLAARRGQAVTVHVHGRSGAGKTFLVQHFLEEVSAGGRALVLAGRCYEQESVPYKALDSLIDALSRHLARLRWDEAHELLPPDTPALARLFPVLRRATAVADAVAAAPPEVPDPHELRRRAFAALRTLLGRLAALQPLVLHIDDLQWGDADSAALLSDLLAPPDPPPLLLICSYRSEYGATSPCLCALRQQPGHRELEVEALAQDDARHLALGLMGRDDPAAQAHAALMARESGGSPYFLQALVQSFLEGADIAGRPEGPLTLDEVLWRRATGLAEPARRMLEVVSVAGRPLRQDDVLRAARVSPEERGALAPLRVGHLVRSTGPGDADEVEAYHDRVRETVLAHLEPPARRDCHRRLAETLESSGHGDAEALAVHFHGADVPDKAGRYYAEAARQAADALAFDRAAGLYRLALELRPGEGDEARGLHGRLGDALANAGRGAEAARAYLTAAEGADAVRALDLRRRAAYQFCASGRLAEGRAALRDVLAGVGLRLPATPSRTLLALLAARARLWLRGLGFRERPESAVDEAELRRIDVSWSASAGLSMFDVLNGANFQTRNLLLALRAGEPYRIARGLAWEAAHISNSGRPAWRRTEQLLHAARTLAERINQPHALGLATMAAGIAEFTMGRWRPALAFLERAETTLRQRCTGVAWELDTVHVFVLWALFYAGDLGEMTRRTATCLKEADERGDQYESANLGSFVGPVVRLIEDDPAGARQTLQSSVERWSPEGFHLQHLTALMAHTYVDLYSGEVAAAWERWRRRWADVLGSHFLYVQVLRVFVHELHARTALAMAARSPAPKPLLRQAEAGARRIERERLTWALPLAQWLRAGAAAVRGDRTAAADLLERAAAGFEVAEMRLFATAARRRLAQLRGAADQVTAADAWLAAQGVRVPARLAAALTPWNAAL
jgi:serine/threonine protein kinase/tetratricopeptide (TPR) repeat protein